jgi:hypothetical protein
MLGYISNLYFAMMENFVILSLFSMGCHLCCTDAGASIVSDTVRVR